MQLKVTAAAKSAAAVVLALSVGLAGCTSSESKPAVTTPQGPQSPDASSKDITKTPAPAGSSEATPAQKMAPAPKATPSAPQSPDVAAKDPSKSPAPKMAEQPMKPFKDATHTLTSDEAIYKSSSGGTPQGLLKKGTPVLVLVPGATYSQVTTGDGTTGYVETSALAPKGK